MTELQKLIIKLEDFIYLCDEFDEDNPHLELTRRECKILLEQTL